MSFEKGSRLGAFEILEPLGTGGMGAVYRARDTTLGRDVAIKLIPESLTQDAERLARFEREAKILSSVNHPGIATLHGLETHGATRYIVMELVEGETLAELIARGPLPVARARALFIQIADALAAAHGRGIVHRDLKPANIMVSAGDRIKLLDFGLAKVIVEQTPTGAPSQSPTRTRDTKVGTVLGTGPYMSPEQARGEPVDVRTDLWALGCCLFEALSGKRAFDGASTAEILVGALSREPDFDALPPLPPMMELALRRCLAKNASSRMHSAADVRLLLEETETAPAPRSSAPTGTRARVAAALALGVLIGALSMRLGGGSDLDEREPEVIRFSIERPAGELGRSSTSVAISPDGATLAWIEQREGSTTLYVRSLEEDEPRAILESESLVNQAFFSPDGEWIGFLDFGQVKRLATNGGSVQTIGGTSAYGGAAWGDDGLIYFANSLGISAIPENGGAPVAITTVDPVDARHRWPSVLPGGKGILYAEGLFQNWGGSRIFVKPPDAPARLLVEGGTAPKYVRTGHLLYAKDGALMVAKFDLDRLALVGGAVPVLDSVLHDRSSGAVQYGVSREGSLLYAPGDYGETEHVLMWVDPSGRATPLPFPPRHYRQPRLSLDGRKLAVGVGSENANIWVYDLDDGSATRLTFEGNNDLPVWTLDGTRVVFQSQRTGVSQVFSKRADGSDAAERITFTDTYLAPHGFTPGGDLLLVEATTPLATDILWQPRDGDELQTFLATEHWENSPVLSPDGRFVAYRSNESERYEVYVQTFPPTGAKWQISTEGGNEPAWSRDGRSISYRNGRKMMSVPVSTEPSFHFGPPALLFEGDYTRTVPNRTNYDVSSDGRFLMIRRSGRDEGTRELAVVLHWASELSRLGIAN